MKSNFFLSVFCVAVCYFSFIVVVESSLENALMFNPETQKLEEHDEDYDRAVDRCTYCITACLASSTQELRANQKISITKRGMFLQSVYQNKIMWEVKTRICKELPQATIVRDTSNDLYKTGYELLYNEGSIQLQDENYQHFSKVNIDEDGAVNMEEDSVTDDFRVEKIVDESNTKFEVYQNNDLQATLIFFWIPVLSIRVDGFRRQISFTKDEINNYYHYRTMARCKDFNLGDQIQKVPSEKWLKYKARISRPVEDADFQKDHSDTEEYILEETQIMPMRYFHTLTSRLATCTYLNIAYVWKSIAIDQYKRNDLFLYSMYRVWSHDINIIFGATGRSNELSSDQLEKINNPENKILQKFPIPVPEILYRLVEYRENETTFTAIIIIHNTLQLVPDKKRICGKESELKGWSYMKDDQKEYPDAVAEPAGLTYVCPVTKKTIRQLGVRYEIPTNMSDFNIQKPQMDRIDQEVQYVMSIRIADVDVD